MTKVLLLGIGRWGANHLRVLHSMPVELFVAEKDPKRLEAARKLGVPGSHLSDDHARFAKEVEAAVVVTPAQSHFPLCLEFLSSGKDVFVEKPITLDSGEARQLAELATAKGRILQVGHIFRFDPASLWLREMIQNGEFGRVRILKGSFSGFKRPRQDSGVMFADAIHFVDLFNFLLGRMPSRVFAALHDFLGRGMDDASLLSLDYEPPAGRVWGTVETNYFVPGKDRELVVIGDKLSAVCDYNSAQYKIKTYQNTHTADGADFKAVEGAVRQIESPPEEPLLAELRAFLAAIRSRETPRADGWAGYESVRVLEAAVESNRTGRAVPL
jgi:predicted dehydrogenase